MSTYVTYPIIISRYWQGYFLRHSKKKDVWLPNGTDLLLLSFIGQLCFDQMRPGIGNENREKDLMLHFKNNRMYVGMQYETLLEMLPILGTESKSTIEKRISLLLKRGFLTKLIDYPYGKRIPFLRLSDPHYGKVKMDLIAEFGSQESYIELITENTSTLQKQLEFNQYVISEKERDKFTKENHYWVSERINNRASRKNVKRVRKFGKVKYSIYSVKKGLKGWLYCDLITRKEHYNEYTSLED